jgi:hypothetical protein
MKPEPQYPDVKLFKTRSSPILQIGNVTNLMVSNILNIEAYVPNSPHLNEFVIVETITSREFAGQIERIAFTLEYPLKAQELVDRIYKLIDDYEYLAPI